LHAFNGWADQFLGTPANGIQDTYVSVGTSFYGVKLLSIYHHYSDEDGNIDFGQEVNVLAVKKLGQHYKVLLKYAHYEADHFKSDTDKFWFMLGMSF
jgi:hypothetical protein